MKQRSKLEKIFYKNCQRKSDHIKVLEKSAECAKKILEAKKNYLLKMTTKFEHYTTTTKRSMLRHLYLLVVVLFQTIAKQQIFLITFLFLYAHL